jgi:tRNA-splicing ligase RtcB
VADVEALLHSDNQSNARRAKLLARFFLMNTKDFLRLGVPLGEATRRATDFVAQYVLRGGDTSELEDEIKAIVANPALFAEDPMRKELAKAIVNAPPPPRAEPVKYRQWGEGLEHEAVMQMEKACLLPVCSAGALMPDAHVGYGLPIGGGWRRRMPYPVRGRR